MGFKQKSFISVFLLGILLLIFGQNFDLVPKSRLMFPSTEKRDLLSFGNRVPAMVERVSPFTKYFLLSKNQPVITGNDLSYEKASQKVLDKSIENFLSDDDFKNSDLGRTLHNMEERTRPRIRIWGGRSVVKSNPKHKSDFTPDSGLIDETADAATEEVEEKEILLSANQQRAAVVWKSKAMETTCGYSLQDQKINLFFQGSESSAQSFGVDYDRKLDTSSLRMQVNW